MTARLLPLLIAAALVACGAPDLTPEPIDPAGLGIAATTPNHGSTGVGVVTSVSIQFSAPVDAASLVVAANPPTELGFREVSADGLEVSYANVIFLPNTPYLFSVSATGQTGQALSGSPTFSFTTGAEADSTAPALLSTLPAQDASNVAEDEVLAFSFSEPMDSTSLVVRVEPAHDFGVAVWSADDTVATFSAPLSKLLPGQRYTVTLNAADRSGNPLAGASPLEFTVAATADVIAPQVVHVAPAAGAMGVALNTSLSLGFSEPMNPATVEAALSVAPLTAMAFSWDATNTLLTLQPSAPLVGGTSYTVTVAASAADVAGNVLTVPFTASFTTAALPDITAPSVVSSLPAAGDTGVLRNATIRVTFSEAMNKASAQSAFSITAPAGLNTGSFTWTSDGRSMTFDPAATFPAGEPITWRVSTAARDLAGNALAQQVSRGFIVIRQGTAVLNSVAALDGHVKTTGAVGAGLTTMLVGDDLSNDSWRALVSFDLSSLPPTTQRITVATLYVYLVAKAGDPLATLGGTARLERVAYGAPLTSSAWGFSRFIGINDSVDFVSTTTAGWKFANRIAMGVSDDWNNRMSRGYRTQFRIQMPELLSNNGVADWLQFYTGDTGNSFCTRTHAVASGASCKPYLVVEYDYL